MSLIFFNIIPLSLDSVDEDVLLELVKQGNFEFVAFISFGIKSDKVMMKLVQNLWKSGESAAFNFMRKCSLKTCWNYPRTGLEIIKLLHCNVMGSKICSFFQICPKYLDRYLDWALLELGEPFEKKNVLKKLGPWTDSWFSLPELDKS